MQRLLRDHLANCFLLLWLVMVYLWQAPHLFKPSFSVTSFLLSTGLFVAHIVLYALGILRAKQLLQQILILTGLTGSVVLLGFFVRNSDSILGLYLALFVEALYLLGQTRLTAGFIFICLVLFWMNIKVIHAGLGLNLVPPLLFVGGYVVIYAQQSAVHRRTQSLLAELEKTHTKLQVTHAQLAAYVLHVEELTREAERQRLARELHDIQGQGLVGLVLQLEAISAHIQQQRSERASAIADQAIKRARAMLTAARQAMDDLRANSVSPSDLPEAVQEEIERFMVTTGIPCKAELIALSRVPALFCEDVLRAITEGLTNIARHAQAQQAWVCSVLVDESVIIEVGDNGKGFDVEAVEQLIGHYGLLGLRERTHLIHGNFAMLSSTGAGTTLRFTFPLKEAVKQ